MKPFFILSTPRSRGSLLVRLLDNGHGIRCAGEAGGLLRQTRQLEKWWKSKGGAESWRMGRASTDESCQEALAGLVKGWVNPGPETVHYGLRDSYLGRESWKLSCDWWSWLLTTFPESRLIFLTRDREETELSMSVLWPMWQPSYGACDGCCLRIVKAVQGYQRDFHALNPSRTVLVDAAELLDYEAIAAKLEKVGLPLARETWERELAITTGSRKELAETLVYPDTKQATVPAVSAVPGADPFETGAKAGPTGDPFAAAVKVIAPPAGYTPKKPLSFIERDPQHPEAIVYPWLSSAAVWDELKYSLRSVERHFSDKECPIYIIGDAPPAWLRDGGRVRFIATDYSRSKREGLFQAFSIGTQLAKRVLWMNDDIYLLKDQGWDDFRVALTEGVLSGKVGRLLQSTNGWQRWMGEATADLHHAGVQVVRRFATHTPYLFEREKSVEIFRKFHLPYKGGFVNLYHNWHRTAHRPCSPAKAKRLPGSPRARFLNHGARGPDTATQFQLAERFDRAAPWELKDPAAAFAPEVTGLPGWFDYGDAYRRIVDLAPPGAELVELGVWAGASIAYLAEYAYFSKKGLRVTGYDSFAAGSDLGTPGGVSSRDWERSLRKALGKCPIAPEIRRYDSAEAAKMHDDESVFAVWIDAAHDAESVERDVRAWLPKLVPGGLMGGHDFGRQSVKEGLAAAGIHVVPVSRTSWLMTAKPRRKAAAEQETWDDHEVI